MTEHLEIEYKNLLTLDEFNKLMNRFGITNNSFHQQTNHYFDTADFFLKSRKSALRIREQGSNYELTLKQPTTDSIGLLETNQEIKAEVAQKMLFTGEVPQGSILDKLKTILPQSTSISCFGHLTTTRAELSYQNGLLVLDKSTYLDQIDYELEYETDDAEKGHRAFYQLLISENIPVRTTAHKVQRLFNQLNLK